MWIEVYDPTPPPRGDGGFATYTLMFDDVEWLQRTLSMMVGLYPERWAVTCAATAISARNALCDNRHDSLLPFDPLTLDYCCAIFSTKEIGE